MANPRRVPKRLNHEPKAVRWARERSGLSQTALAKRAGLARTLVVEIEKGTRSATPENLLKLAEAMNCPVVVLERKREPETAPPAARPVPEPGMQGDERTDEPALPELRGTPVGGS